MTFGSAFHLRYVQRLQNSHGRTPRAELEGSCCWCDEFCWFSPAVHSIPPPKKKETSKPLAGKKSSRGSFAGFGNPGGVDRDVAPPGLHLQKLVHNSPDPYVCQAPTGLQWCLWGRGIVKTLSFIQPKSYNGANVRVCCKVLSNPQQRTACSVSVPSLFGVTTGTPCCV